MERVWPTTKCVTFSVFLAALTGCVVPMQKTVYEPACAIASSPSCEQRDDKLIMEVQKGAKLNISASLVGINRKVDETISLCIFVDVDPGVTFRLLSPTATVESKAWGTPKTVEITDRPNSHGISDSTGMSRPQREQHFVLWLESLHGTLCETNIPAVTEFMFRMPDVAVNGQMVRIPPVRFVTKKKWVVEGLCC